MRQGCDFTVFVQIPVLSDLKHDPHQLRKSEKMSVLSNTFKIHVSCVNTITSDSAA